MGKCASVPKRDLNKTSKRSFGAPFRELASGL